MAATPQRTALRPDQSVQQTGRSGLKAWGADFTTAPVAWDSWRRDPLLCFEGADCAVYLYKRGQSRRGPAFLIPLDLLVSAQCLPLLSSIHTPQQQNKDEKPSRAELYLPSPDLAGKEEAANWHLTTRNFFAWVTERPLYGRQLGHTLSELFARMRLWRTPAADCVEDLLVYADQMGYSAIQNCPDHALAMLDFAETNQLRNVWIDAFAHCVGMTNSLRESPEFETITRKTKALITRAFLEMDLHTDRARGSIGNFLEEELSAANLGLDTGARRHLDNFRSFLQTYHVARYGYWPPTRSSAFPKELYLSMYVDFSNLYSYLADTQSSEPWRSNNGGICVHQTVCAFNERQKYDPLPFSLPLLPRTALSEGRPKSQMSLRALVTTAKENSSRHHRTEKARASLRSASNTLPADVYDNELLQQYMAFEDKQAEKPDADVSLADARRVRWLLIYGVLQTLGSIMSAPPEVRTTEGAPYALCVLTEGIPPWEFESRSASIASQMPTPLSATFPPDVQRPLTSGTETPPISIEPDCDASEFLKPRRDDLGDATAKRDSAQLRKTANRASFLKRASTMRKRSNSQPIVVVETGPSEFVSGRTLAELVYGEKLPESPVPDASAAADKAHDEKDSQDNVEEPRSPTSDEMHFLLPANSAEYSQTPSSESSSVPSLAFSTTSREVADGDPLELEHAYLVNAHAGTRRIDEDMLERGYRIPRGFVKIMGPGVTRTIHSGSLPRSVTRGYDYFEQIEGAESGTATPDSPSLGIDRAAAIALDGNIDDESIAMYRSQRRF